jgi:hypothetical protein
MRTIQSFPLIFNVDVNVRRQLSTWVDTVQSEIRSDVRVERVYSTIRVSTPGL